MRNHAAMLALCLSFATPCAWAQASPPEPATTSPQAPPSAPQILRYPDSAAGLTALAHDLLAAMKKGDAATTQAYLNALVLPDPNSWFPDVFEKDLGRESATEYAEMLPSLPSILAAAFQNIADSEPTAINGIRFVQTCEPKMDGNMIVLLSMRRHDKPLYEIRYGAGDMERAIWAFAYADGSFRYIGNTRLGFGKRLKDIVHPGPVVQGQAKPEDSGPHRVQVGASVQQSKMTHQVPPIYPDVAKANHVQGTVILHAIIGKDGEVQQIQVKQGPCMLDEAAIRAVRQWRYSPTTINGSPVEIDTTISVIFTLSR
ncbi:MAG: energy transducer TonB [Candidatus Acidiferrales bacterium]